MASRPANSVSVETFVTPLLYRGAVPLRIAVYDGIASAIRSSTLRPGELLPPEADIAVAFRVSRTVMREALILLEEDGLIRTKHGVGRFVADELPTSGLERLLPIEEMLNVPAEEIELVRVQARHERVTDLTRRGLSLDPEDTTLIWESVAWQGPRAVALSQEWIPTDAGAIATPAGELLEAVLVLNEGSNRSLLAVIISAFRYTLGPAQCQLSVSLMEGDRANLLGLTQSSPVLVATQFVGYRGTPLYVAKHLLMPEAGHLSLTQSTS